MDMNNLRGVLGRLEQKDSALGSGGVTGDQVYTAASIAPVTGEAIAVKELPDDIRTIGELFSQGYDEMDFKKMGMGAAYTAAVAAGLIPVAGVLGRMGKNVIKPLIKTAKNTDELGALPTSTTKQLEPTMYDHQSYSHTIPLGGDTFKKLKSNVIPDEKTYNLINDKVDEKISEIEKIYGNDPQGRQILDELLGVKLSLDEVGLKITDNTFPAKLNFDVDEGARLSFNELILKDLADLPTRMNSLPNLFAKLNDGFLPDAKTTQLTLDNVENKLLDMADDGFINTPDYEDLEMISDDLKQVISKNEFPSKLELHTSAEDNYKNKIIDDLADIYMRPPEGSGQGAFRMNQELLQEDYGIKLSDYETVN